MKYLLALIQLLTKLRLHIVSAWLRTHILYHLRVTRNHRKKPTWICVGDEAIIIMSFICRLRSSSISLLKSSSNIFSWILNLRFFFTKFYVSFSRGLQIVLKQNKDNFVKKSCRFRNRENMWWTWPLFSILPRLVFDLLHRHAVKEVILITIFILILLLIQFKRHSIFLRG